MKTILIIIGIALAVLLVLMGYACIRLETSLQFRRRRRGAPDGSVGA